MRKALFAGALVATLALTLAGGSAATATGPECPAGAAAITNLSFRVNGGPASMSGLIIGGVTSGDTVTASFTVAPGCTAVPLNFSAYKAVASVANASNVGLQTLASNANGTFGAGANTLSITVPNCFFQIDLYRGPLVTEWNTVNLLSFHGYGASLRQMLGNATGGSVACQAPVTVPTVTVPTVTVPTVTVPTVTVPTVTVPTVTVPTVTPLVVAGVQTGPGTPAVQVAAAAPVAVRAVNTAPLTTIASLPSSSTSRSDLPAVLGIAFIILGAALLLNNRAVRTR